MEFQRREKCTIAEWPVFSAGTSWYLPCSIIGMAGAAHFRELVCWQLAQELKLKIYELAERPALARDSRFRDQFRDAAASAPRNIAEGFGRRSHPDFARFLDVARGSMMECQNHLQDALDRGYLDRREFDSVTALAQRACGATAGLQRYLRSSQDR